MDVEVPAAFEWVRRALRDAGTSLPFWPDVQPEDSKGRAVVATVVPGEDLRARKTKIWTRLIYTVWVQDQVGGYWPLWEDAAVINRALDGKTNISVEGGGTVVSCVRERAYKGMVTFKGVDYRQLGGTYRVLIS